MTQRVNWVLDFDIRTTLPSRPQSSPRKPSNFGSNAPVVSARQAPVELREHRAGCDGQHGA